MCATCSVGGEATNNSLLECVAQYTGAHNHMRCLGIDYMMVSWLCAPCIAIPVYIIWHIIGKPMLRTIWSEWGLPRCRMRSMCASSPFPSSLTALKALFTDKKQLDRAEMSPQSSGVGTLV